MVDLGTAAAMAEIVGAATVVGAALFALVQLREHRRQRRQEASLGLMASLLTSDVQDAIMRTWSLPENATLSEVTARGPEGERAALTLVWACENMGVLVHEGVLDLATVDKLVGGTIRDCRRRLEPWLAEQRVRMGSPTFGEWFQWLAEQLEAHGDPRKREGAYLRYAKWRPRRAVR